MYTQIPAQLQFVPYSSNGLTHQARWLLRELLNDRRHPFPCDCGACIFGEYRRARKTKGRTFSKRTFFVFFLRLAFFDLVFCDKTGPDASSIEFDGPIVRNGIYFHRVNAWTKRVKELSRQKTLEMIRELEREERGKAREFLGGILKKKSFYTYYARAADPELFAAVERARKELLQPLGFHGKDGILS